MKPRDEDFEQPIIELERKIKEFASYPETNGNLRELEKLNKKLEKTRKEVFSKLNPWQRTLVARNPKRPYFLDYVNQLFEDFVEIHGDRRYADDQAIVGGIARFEGMPVVAVGHQKGRDVKEKLRRNFGMPNPEGYRKALRIMKYGEKFKIPVLSFVDTVGAYPGIGAEERGQAEAIAHNLREISSLRTPIVVIVTGEGGSGGALAIGIGDIILMLQYATYSVISPEGCAAILWKDQSKVKEAASNMKMTARDLHRFGLIDKIVTEPLGGAHVDPANMSLILKKYILEALDELEGRSAEELLALRYGKFRKMGELQKISPAEESDA
jgi:acetyl-CoA carboxylase carboxyl transferase subunit alpha